MTVSEGEFYESVTQRADLTDEADARDATQAVLSALGERLDEHRSHQLADDLPKEIADHLTDGASGRRFSSEEFIERVTERTDRADIGEPELLSEAVIGTVLDSVDDETSTELRERLGELEYDAFVPE
ncbi:DUF2267 domain-containing protein [Natrialba sp. SSL1]|uniref:DUF2267 domain-containing protein n=1 Tax=Natrialba sp. SSL1 TaxID=1869245 RepID=UPI0008F8C068|nr:DUF2267 domain-containing protein [Natrialba sp. SSL1]OIB55639.1 hypothetical protein BBD46_04900 [Natrialba sp. SSL1]